MRIATEAAVDDCEDASPPSSVGTDTGIGVTEVGVVADAVDAPPPQPVTANAEATTNRQLSKRLVKIMMRTLKLTHALSQRVLALDKHRLIVVYGIQVQYQSRGKSCRLGSINRSVRQCKCDIFC